MIGLPWKNQPENTKQIFDYEMMVFNYLQKNKLLWIKKARGLGITEFLLRYMIWLCVFDNRYQNSRFSIITGPRIDLAVELIDRIKDIFGQIDPAVYDERDVIATVNGCTIQAFPSHTIRTARGYTNVKFILLDEADFFPIGQQQEARFVAEGYILKDKPWIVMVSTPYEPGGLFEQMEKEENSNYKRIFLDYTYGLDRIYDRAEIEHEKKQAYFETEYNLKYGFGTGNLLLESTIQKIEEMGRLPQYTDLDTINYATKKSMGIDPGYGLSRFAFVITEEVDGKIRIIYAKEFERADFEHMIRLAYDLIMTYHLNNGINKTFIDASAPSFIRGLKAIINENTQYEEQMKKGKARNPLYNPVYDMNVVPVPFSIKHKAMLEHTKSLIEQERVMINGEAFPELIADLRMARVEGLVLEKGQQTRMDLFDALRMSLEYHV